MKGSSEFSYGENSVIYTVENVCELMKTSSRNIYLKKKALYKSNTKFKLILSDEMMIINIYEIFIF